MQDVFSDVRRWVGCTPFYQTIQIFRPQSTETFTFTATAPGRTYTLSMLTRIHAGTLCKSELLHGVIQKQDRLNSGWMLPIWVIMITIAPVYAISYLYIFLRF